MAWFEGAFGGSDAPVQAIKDPANGIVNANKSRARPRLRRKINGRPIRKAQKTVVVPPHGFDGPRLEALWLAAIVTVDVPDPPEANVTAVAVAVRSAGVPSADVTLVVNETVPA